MKKIIIMSSNLEMGGIQKYITDLTNVLSEKYNIELIITTRNNTSVSYHINNKVKVKYLFSINYNEDEVRRYKRERKYLKLFELSYNRLKDILLKRKTLIHAIKCIKCDYLITTSLYETKIVNKYLKNDKIKKLFIDDTYPTKKYKNKLIRNITNYNKLIICNDELKGLYKEVEDKIEVIPYFIDDKIKEKSKLSNKNIISVGNFNKEKNLLELLDIMKLVVEKDNEINLTIVGDGKERNKVLKRIKELNLENNVELTGYLNNLEVESKMLNSSMYAITNDDILSLSTLEAMNLGLPIITFYYLFGSKKLLNKSILIENGNKEKYASMINYFFTNKKDLKEYAKNSKEKAKEYSIENAKKSWADLLNSFSKKKKASN